MRQNCLVQMMKTINKFGFIFGLISLTTISGCSNIEGRANNAPPLILAQNVDSQKYLGKWYEIARYPNSFESDCQKVTANYSARNDGRINVVNTCVSISNPNKVKSAKAIAQIVNDNTATLAVNFAPIPLLKGNGNYHILHVSDNYDLAVVGEPSGKYLWFLARNKTLKPEELALLKDVATKNQYDLKYLEYVNQD